MKPTLSLVIDPNHDLDTVNKFFIVQADDDD